MHKIERAVVKSGKPVLYYLMDGPKHAFVRGELQVVPVDTEALPEGWYLSSRRQLPI